MCYTFHSQNEQQLEAAWDNEEELREELERQREIQGFWQIVGGAFLIVTGTLCIVCTLGAATPIVVTGMVAGGGTILFGASDMLEGGQNIYFGANGDLSITAFNPLRDTVFMGNQEIYDNTKNVFAFTAGAMIPIGKAYGELGKLSLRTVGTIVGEEIISDQAGNLANMAVTEIGEQLDWNPYFTQTFAMVTGIWASNKTSNTLVGLDQKFNFSGNFPDANINVNSIDNVDFRRKEVKYDELGQEIMSIKDYKNFKKEMESIGIGVEIDSKGNVLKGDYVAGFNPLDGVIYIKKKPTKLSARHEAFHAEQYLSLGKDKYLKLRPELREEYVFKRIMESNLFNEAEKYTAQRYIYYIRNNKQWPPIEWKGYD